MTVDFLLLFTFKQFKEYNSATSVKQLQMSKDNRVCSINPSKHLQTYKSAFFANVFDKLLDASCYTNFWSSNLLLLDGPKYTM